MFGYTSNLDTTLELMDRLRRRMDRVFDDFEPDYATQAGGYPPTNLYDTGTSLVLELEVPGVTEKDFELTLTKNVLMVAARRGVDVPEGYSVHRQERRAVEFSRSYALPTEIDPEKTAATLKNGVLTITLEKAPELKPRQISVRVK